MYYYSDSEIIKNSSSNTATQDYSVSFEALEDDVDNTVKI